jgi:hypothetical protein
MPLYYQQNAVRTLAVQHLQCLSRQTLWRQWPHSPRTQYSDTWVTPRLIQLVERFRSTMVVDETRPGPAKIPADLSPTVYGFLREEARRSYSVPS